MKKILFCLLLLPCLIQAQRLTVDSVLLKKQGVIPAKWVSVKTFSAIDTINEIQTLYNHNLYDLKNIDTTTRTKVLTRKATDSLINYALTGTVDTKGNWDASGNTLPSTSVKTGDKWTISVKGFVSPDSFYVGDVIIAKIDDPGQTVTNWNHIYASQPKSVNLVFGNSAQSGAVGYTGVTPRQYKWYYNISYLTYYGNIAATGLGRFDRGLSATYSGDIGAAIVGEGINSQGGFFRSSTGNALETRTTSGGVPLLVNKLTGTSNIAEFKFNSSNVAYINYNGKGTFNGGIESQTVGVQAIYGYAAGHYGVLGVSTTSAGVLGLSTDNIGVSAQSTNYRGVQASTSKNKYIAAFSKIGTNSGDKAFVDTFGYYIGLKPTFSSVFFDSTRIVELDQNTPKIISNTWGNLWPNSVLIGFTENKDTAIITYTGNYNICMDLNAYVGAAASFRYHVKKRAANSTTKTTIYRKEVSNAGTIVNRNITLNWNFTVGDRIWFEIENVTNGNDVTVYGGTLSITANYLNP